MNSRLFILLIAIGFSLNPFRPMFCNSQDVNRGADRSSLRKKHPFFKSQVFSLDFLR